MQTDYNFEYIKRVYQQSSFILACSLVRATNSLFAYLLVISRVTNEQFLAVLYIQNYFKFQFKNANLRLEIFKTL